ncbi:MAG: methylamine dehydrogenase (amicyanin) light chain [Deltaproteobacteria bacterium]|nr:methylamine dehydrogenase (amicyanin) light chain [Deltaproteobacteria bacterium]MBW2383667.1 methylamine dehydrogenase (amicyanin) light chain [Deltaproteobacteria bacterium]MBW2696754.1 methylamine dehydrogenase (amicyanin) light chain [Deltaproteobacteria bacterium]
MRGDGIDRVVTRLARGVARRSSRRGFLARLGVLLVGGTALPLLPVARASENARTRAPLPGEPGRDKPHGDPEDCDYWRYCSIDGFLSSCCGGTHTSCPPGTQMSPVTWVGTCRNPEDGRDYVISYNDCCGKDVCGKCFCRRTEGDMPVYYPGKSNDINWCMGSEGVIYNSTVAIVVGVATEDE